MKYIFITYLKFGKLSCNIFMGFSKLCAGVPSDMNLTTFSSWHLVTSGLSGDLLSASLHSTDQGLLGLGCVQLFAALWTEARHSPLIMGFSRQEYWSGLPCLPPEELPNPGIKPGSPALQAESLPSERPGTPGIDNLWKGEIQGAGHQIAKLSFASITHANDWYVRRFSSL